MPRSNRVRAGVGSRLHRLGAMPVVSQLTRAMKWVAYHRLPQAHQIAAIPRILIKSQGVAGPAVCLSVRYRK